MIEKNIGTIESCPKLKTYEFDSIFELVSFEDQIALDICPIMDDIDIKDWSKRIAIYEALRPIDPKTKQKFNGQLTNIVLSELPDAYDRMYDVKERGLSFNPTLGKPYKKHASDNAEFYKEFTRGYNLTAEAKSTGMGTIGLIDAYIWYLPAPQLINNIETHSRPGTDNIRRYVTQPVLERFECVESFPKNPETIRNIGRTANKFNVCKITNFLNVL